jgi:hypothetical protein
LTLLALAGLLPRLPLLAALAGLALIAGLALVRMLAGLALAALIALTLTALALLHSLALLTGLVLLLAGLTLLTRTLIAVISHGNFLELGDWFAPAMKTWFRAIRSGFPVHSRLNPPVQNEPSVT